MGCIKYFLNSSDSHPKQRSQLLSSIASAPSVPTASEIFDATHVMSSFVESRGTVSGTSSYFLKAAHAGFSTGGTHTCKDDSPGGPLKPVARFLCIGHPGGDTLPPPWRWPDGKPAKAYPKTLYHSNSGPRLRPPPCRRSLPFPLGQSLPPRRPPPNPRTDLSPRGACAA